MSNKKIEVAIIDTKKNEIRFEKIRDNLKDFYSIIDCDTIDIVTRTFADKHRLDIICDDEGLLKSPRAPYSVFTYRDGDDNPCEIIVGTVIISSHDEDGFQTSLTKEQMADLHKCFGTYCDSFGERRFGVKATI